MQYELWLNPEQGGLHLFTTLDPSEMLIHYKDALRVYRAKDLQLIASREWSAYEITFNDLRDAVRTSVL